MLQVSDQRMFREAEGKPGYPSAGLFHDPAPMCRTGGWAEPKSVGPACFPHNTTLQLVGVGMLEERLALITPGNEHTQRFDLVAAVGDSDAGGLAAGQDGHVEVRRKGAVATVLWWGVEVAGEACCQLPLPHCALHPCSSYSWPRMP